MIFVLLVILILILLIVLVLVLFVHGFTPLSKILFERKGLLCKNQTPNNSFAFLKVCSKTASSDIPFISAIFRATNTT